MSRPLLRSFIESRLAIQEQHEGQQSVALLRILLRHAQTGSQWRAATRPRFHRYGTQSYECHIFYDIEPWIEGFTMSVMADLLS